MEFNDVFEYIGDIGLYQCLLYALVCLQAVITASQNLGINFASGHQEHWCLVNRCGNE